MAPHIVIYLANRRYLVIGHGNCPIRAILPNSIYTMHYSYQQLIHFLCDNKPYLGPYLATLPALIMAICVYSE